MEIPLELERRLQQRWLARFRSIERIGVKRLVKRMPARRREPPLHGLEQRQETDALLSGSISAFAENGLVR
jgi:hypothetical protein